MPSVFRLIARLGSAGDVLVAIVASGIGIGLLLAFILGRRAYRHHQIRRREKRTLLLRRQWAGILIGRVAPESWRLNRLSRDIVEAMLLDRLEGASPEEARQIGCQLRTSGLLDMRIYEARRFRGWHRRRALVSLGRMRAPEAIPALAEALDDPNPETRLAAVRGLGRTSLPEAAVPILDRIIEGEWHVPQRPVQNALLGCCRSRPAVLVPYLGKADDATRPMLARVLGEVATAELDEDLLLLAADPSPEVRASAARALAEAKPSLALAGLATLASDQEWFVRLRAVAALAKFEDRRNIGVLVERLCDSNRYVRLRAAAALARLEAHIEEILERVTRTGDRYALQALISELERSGGILHLIDALLSPRKRRLAESALLSALKAGAQGFLLDALVHHTNWRVRLAVARLLGGSGETQLMPQLEWIQATARSPREQRVIRWVLRQLRSEEASHPRLRKVLA